MPALNRFDVQSLLSQFDINALLAQLGQLVNNPQVQAVLSQLGLQNVDLQQLLSLILGARFFSYLADLGQQAINYVVPIVQAVWPIIAPHVTDLALTAVTSLLG
jgi:hypothetical protein